MESVKENLRSDTRLKMCATRQSCTFFWKPYLLKKFKSKLVFVLESHHRREKEEFAGLLDTLRLASVDGLTNSQQ